MMAEPTRRPECEPLNEWHGGEEMPTLLPELVRVVERAVAQFVRRYPPPARYDCTEWRAECLGEAWRCVGDALRTYDPTRGVLGTYVGRAAWRHLLDFRARECRWAQRACVSLDVPKVSPDGEACECEWVDPASEGLEQVVCERVAVEQALAALSEADRQLVEWVWMEGMSQVEAAARLGVSQQAVAKHLKRVKAWLRAQLGEMAENPGDVGCILEGSTENYR